MRGEGGRNGLQMVALSGHFGAICDLVRAEKPSVFMQIRWICAPTLKKQHGKPMFNALARQCCDGDGQKGPLRAEAFLQQFHSGIGPKHEVAWKHRRFCRLTGLELSG
jgi:hypothetical protein